MKKYLIRKWIFFALSILTVSFIFGQSLMSRAASSGESTKVLGTVQRVLVSLNVEVNEFPLHVFIRKSAHFAEFSALGVCVGGYAVNLGYQHNRKYIALPALLTLLTAVCDEFIQTFSGRAGMVSDIVLDYCGALFGLLLVLGYVLLSDRIAKKKKRKLRNRSVYISDAQKECT